VEVFQAESLGGEAEREGLADGLCEVEIGWKLGDGLCEVEIGWKLGWESEESWYRVRPREKV